MKKQILELRGQGKSYREIAAILGIGKSTVEKACNPVGCRQQQRRWRNRRRRQLVEENGGGCKICGYKKCITALDFHHKDADKKEFSITRALSNSVSMQRLRKEIEKCVLLCSNCHHEVHEGILAL